MQQIEYAPPPPSAIAVSFQKHKLRGTIVPRSLKPSHLRYYEGHLSPYGRSVRKGNAGKPALLYRLPSGLSAQSYRT